MSINTIHNIIRYILAACFVLSGLLKAVAISAFEQEVQMYGSAYIGEWVHDYSSEIALAVCVVEIIVGIASLWRRCAVLTGIIFLGMLLFFVYLTAVNLFFPTIMGSIETCGCFGELIHFTPVSSFVKSVVLLLLASVNIYLAAKVKKGLPLTKEKGDMNNDMRANDFFSFLASAMILLSSVAVISCDRRLSDALDMAGDNRGVLEMMLRYYEETGESISSEFFVGNRKCLTSNISSMPEAGVVDIQTFV